MARIVIEDFDQYIDKTFKVSFTEEHVFDLMLLEATETKAIAALGLKPFVLYFSTDINQPIFRQGTYTLKHPEKGDMPLFFIPRQPDNDSAYYEVIIQ